MRLILSFFLFLFYQFGIAQFQIKSSQVLNPITNAYPHWSPDGSKIAFQSNRNGSNNIYVMDADGKNRIPLTNNIHDNKKPNWSPNGKEIIFISDRMGNEDVFIMNADGSNPKQLTTHPLPDEFPFWHPDGQKIIFSSFRNKKPDTRSLYDFNIELYEIEKDGSNLKRITNSPKWDIYGSYSPDGKSILYYHTLEGDQSIQTKHNLDLFIANADGSNPVNITNNPYFDIFASWSPDGEWIVFSSNRSYPNQGEHHQQEEYNYDLYLCKKDGSQVQQLTHTPGFEDARAKWSPDGKKIAFTRSDSKNHNMDIVIIDIKQISFEDIQNQKFYYNAHRQLCQQKDAAFYQIQEADPKHKGKIIKTDYFLNGQKKSSSNYFFSTPNQQDGFTQNWFKNKQLESEGHYFRNIKTGLWTYYHRNGQKAARRFYENGIITKSEFWTEGGQVISPTEVEVHRGPSFPGGREQLKTYLSKNLSYPVQAKKDRLEGTVIVRFILSEEGQIQYPYVSKGIREDLDKEALRLVREMPKWEPNVNHNRFLSIPFGLKVRFKLAEE